MVGPGARDDVSSHTLVVHREDGAGSAAYLGGREPFLQRWLFSPRLLIIALILVLGVGLGVGGWWLTTGRYAQVPVVAGDPVAQATAALTADGFTVKGRQVHSNTVQKGTVVGTSPAGRVSKGTHSRFLVSSGPFTSVVPDVQNDTLAAAQAALQRLHLASTTAEGRLELPRRHRDRHQSGRGHLLAADQAGRYPGLSGPAAARLRRGERAGGGAVGEQHGVTLHQQPDNNSQQPAGHRHRAAARRRRDLQPGETVTVNVSTGPQIVNVPNPIGMSTQQATQLLQQAGFQVQVNNYGPFGKVFDFSPVGQAPRGSTITLDVGF